jgi:peptidoglycan/LPS O-acetylase OafA/YrhL
VAAFDFYRGAAVAAIVLFHLLGQSGVLLRLGTSLPAQLIWGTLPYAIAVFFIVSGFVMFLPTAARGGDFGSVAAFAIRRAARLFPAFWLALLVCLALLAWLPDAPLPTPGLGEIAINFAGQQTWVMLFDASRLPGFGVDPPVWTLTLEIGFYIVLPFVAAAYFRRPWVGLVAAAAISILWRDVFTHLDVVASVLDVPSSEGRPAELEFADNRLPQWAFAFGAGMTLAWAYVRLHGLPDRARVLRLAPRVALVGALALCGLAFWAGSYAVDNRPGQILHEAWQSSLLITTYTAVLAVIMLALAFVPRLQAPFSLPAVRGLADISYGVYLIHWVILWVIAVKFSPVTAKTSTTFLVLLATVVPLSCLYGYASARFLEQPIRRWAHRLARRVASGRAAPAPAGSPALTD